MTQSVYEALLNSNAVIEFDIYGKILWANSNFLKLVKYDLDDIVGKHHRVFITNEEFQNLEYQSMWKQLSEGVSQSGEFKRVRKDGTVVWIQGSYTPVRNVYGDVIKIIKMALDITEKKTLSENLAKKNKELQAAVFKAKTATEAKTAFLANMSHEIRTPLNSIIGITDTLSETDLSTQQRSYVQILQRANYQLMTLINDILDLSKVEAGDIELRKSPFSLEDLLRELYEILNFRAKEKGLTLKLQLDENVPKHLLGDSDRLRQVLMNLVNNSIKFTDHGEVIIRVNTNMTGRPGNLLFSVEDTGIGVHRSKFRDIFKPFSQADSTMTRRFGGTGLGLSIARTLVDSMGGSIWLESELGVGSSFHFTVDIPAVPAESLPARKEYFAVNTDKPPHIPDRLRILIVDDVEDNRNLLGIYLQNTGHEILYADSGIEAVSLAAQISFDIILMDVQMPYMDGYEATQRIREFEKNKNRSRARIFACTANAFIEDQQKSIDAGCDMHLSKPVRKDTLLKSINFVLNIHDRAY